MKLTWTTRLGILGAALTVAILAIGTCRDASKKSAPAGDVGRSESFCTALLAQRELTAKFDPSDMTKRGRYLADQKELNALLVKTAPSALAHDVALQTGNANASLDAQSSLDATSIKAAADVLRSPEHVAATRRMTDHCGSKASAPP